MTEQDWIRKAEQYEAQARAARKMGDETAARQFDDKADGCRYAACQATKE